MSATWPAVLTRPARLPAGAADWFASLAGVLLTRVRLVVGGVTHRLVEVEVYDYSPGHPDPFAHRHPVQLTPGAWYFHRVGRGYRGGSYKGVDLSFGGGESYSGVLFRGLERPDGSRVDGPSKLVDCLLAATGFATVGELDRAVAGRPAWDRTSPVALTDAPADGRPILATARVGLSVKTHTTATADVALDYLFRPYRYLTDPRRTRTGKPHLVAALLAAGLPPAEVSARTGVPRAAVGRYQAALAAGPAIDPADYLGRGLTAAEWLRLAGWWAARHTDRRDK